MKKNVSVLTTESLLGKTLIFLKNKRHYIIVLSFASLVLSAVVYILHDSKFGVLTLCKDYIYSKDYGSCSNKYDLIIIFIERFLFLLSITSTVLNIVISHDLRKKFKLFIKFFVPLAVFVIVVGSLEEFCLMMSCFSLFWPSMYIVMIAFVIALFVLSLSSLFTHKKTATVALSIVLVFGYMYADDFSEWLRERDYWVSDEARYKNDPEKCKELFYVRQQDKCLLTSGLYCDRIQSLDIKEECMSIKNRNKLHNK